MKKMIIISVVVFLAVFLVWPSQVYSDKGCVEKGPTPEFMLQEARDCIPSKVPGSLGGGFKYLKKTISSGQFVQKDSSNGARLYDISGQNDEFFQVEFAFISAAMLALICFASGFFVTRLRRRRS